MRSRWQRRLSRLFFMGTLACLFGARDMCIGGGHPNPTPPPLSDVPSDAPADR